MPACPSATACGAGIQGQARAEPRVGNCRFVGSQGQRHGDRHRDQAGADADEQRPHDTDNWNEHESGQQRADGRTDRVRGIELAGPARPAARSVREPSHGNRKRRPQRHRRKEQQKKRDAEAHEPEGHAGGSILVRRCEERRQGAQFERQRDRKHRNASSRPAYACSACFGVIADALRPASAAPSARPPMNAASTVLEAAMPRPISRVSSRVQLTS